jgi:phosphate transport system protein
MTSTKDKAIRKILSDFDTLSGLTIRQMKFLSKVLVSENSIISEESLNLMIENENRLDDYEVKISHRITSSIVLYNPVASELRNIMACYRMITNLERIGDLVMKTVRIINKLNDTDLLVKNAKSINKMLTISIKMVSKAVYSFVDHDIDAAMWTIKNDTVVDTMNHKILNNLLEEEEFTGLIHQRVLNFMALKSIISSIERMADHAAHIAEASIYAYGGEDVRHTDLKDSV